MIAGLPANVQAKLTAGPGACVIWTGAITSSGYGSVSHEGRIWSVHRLAYTLGRGPIPEAMTVDHLCHNKRCVNLDHLELVTRAENTRRAHRDGLVPYRSKRSRTYCRNGHDYTPENTYTDPSGARVCRQCRRDSYHRTKGTSAVVR